MMTEAFTDLIPIPTAVNTGLTSADEATMLRLFGRPGPLGHDCALPVPALAAKMSHRNVGPFSVWGLKPAVDSLANIFAEVLLSDPDLFHAVKSDGMLCCRARRPNPAEYSNHSWGSASDLYFGSAAASQGLPKAQSGIVRLVPFFNKAGWYWGGGFGGRSVDSMHFEIAKETILAWRQKGMI